MVSCNILLMPCKIISYSLARALSQTCARAILSGTSSRNTDTAEPTLASRPRSGPLAASHTRSCHRCRCSASMRHLLLKIVIMRRVSLSTKCQRKTFTTTSTKRSNRKLISTARKVRCLNQTLHTSTLFLTWAMDSSRCKGGRCRRLAVAHKGSAARCALCTSTSSLRASHLSSSITLTSHTTTATK